MRQQTACRGRWCVFPPVSLQVSLPEIGPLFWCRSATVLRWHVSSSCTRFDRIRKSHLCRAQLCSCDCVYGVACHTDCKLCKPCPAVYNASFSPGLGCPNCTAPPPPPPAPPPPSPSPPPAPGGTPCIRFGHAIAADHPVDATITQGSISHTWSRSELKNSKQ